VEAARISGLRPSDGRLSDRIRCCSPAAASMSRHSAHPDRSSPDSRHAAADRLSARTLSASVPDGNQGWSGAAVRNVGSRLRSAAPTRRATHRRRRSADHWSLQWGSHIAREPVALRSSAHKRPQARCSSRSLGSWPSPRLVWSSAGKQKQQKIGSTGGTALPLLLRPSLIVRFGRTEVLCRCKASANFVTASVNCDDARAFVSYQPSI